MFCNGNGRIIRKPFSIKNSLDGKNYLIDQVARSCRHFKHVRCPNGDVYLCLKRNKQIKKLIEPALTSGDGWGKWDYDDEFTAIDVVLPKSQLPLRIVILRDIATRKNIRYFGCTKTDLPAKKILEKYRYRWLIENGLKDLVHSYFLDEMYPENRIKRTP